MADQIIIQDRGLPGRDGATIWIVNGTPADSVGTNGDVAIDPNASMIYAPKAGGVWPSGVSYKGGQGDQGEPGPNVNTVHPTVGAPDNSIGIDGDIAIDNRPGIQYMYGPKSGGVWPAGVRYKGDVGPTGPPGGRTEYDLFGGNVVGSGEEALAPFLESANNIPMTSGVIRLTYFTARATATRTAMQMYTGTKTTTNSHVMLGVYLEDPTTFDLTLLAATPDDSSLLRSPSTLYTKALAVGWDEQFGLRYAAAALVVVSGTTPEVVGNLHPAAAIAGASRRPRRAGAVTGVTSGVLPSTIANASIGDTGNRPQVWFS
jgi:hypothetical protein